MRREREIERERVKRVRGGEVWWNEEFERKELTRDMGKVELCIREITVREKLER